MKNDKLIQIPKLPGVYVMCDGVGNIIYIGKAKNLKSRISSYFNADIDSKATAIITSMRKIDYILCTSEREALIIERQLIKKIKPHFNSMWKDDKSYPYIKFSINEDFPRLIFTRKKLKDSDLYFGPYPQLFYIKKLVRWLRRLFKIRPCEIDLFEKSLPKKKNVKSCLYYHTEMCYGPCLGRIASEEYKEKVKGIKLFLDGKFKKLENEWKKQMFNLSVNMCYEDDLSHTCKIIYTIYRLNFKPSVISFISNPILESNHRSYSIHPMYIGIIESFYYCRLTF